MSAESFQAACVALFWPEWARMLGVFVFSVVALSVYHILVSFTPTRTRRSTRFAGQGISK
jgi:hypothetical protein